MSEVFFCVSYAPVIRKKVGSKIQQTSMSKLSHNTLQISLDFFLIFLNFVLLSEDQRLSLQ